MAKDPKNISPEDSALFRETVGEVRPLTHDRAIIERPRPPRHHKKSSTAAADHSGIKVPLSDGHRIDDHPQEPAAAEYLRPGIQKGVLRTLRRGQFTVEAELDLHGMTVEEARTALARFIHHCRGEGKRYIRVIHGQGNSSRAGKPVLRGMVQHWLQQLNEVLAFCPAPPGRGGNGATSVLLKRHP